MTKPLGIKAQQVFNAVKYFMDDDSLIMSSDLDFKKYIFTTDKHGFHCEVSFTRMEVRNYLETACYIVKHFSNPF